MGFCYAYWPREGPFTNNAQRNMRSENPKMGKVTFLSQPLIVLLISLWPYLHLGRVYIISFTKITLKSKMQINTIPVSLTFMEEPSYIQCVILDGGEYSSADGQELQGVSKG